MAIPGLTLIGEAINDSVPSTKELYERGDLAGIQALAVEQVAGGARYVDVNVGRRGADFMAAVVRKVQEVVAVPLSIDSPDVAYLRAGLEAYDPARGGGKPILNSISALRSEALALAKLKPCRAILLLTERTGATGGMPCKSAEEEYATAKELFALARAQGFGPDDMIFDPGIMPIGADTESRLARTLDTLRRCRADPALKGCHASVGLSNFTVMLPKKRPNGQPIRSTLESAFLTHAMPLGLDTIIGSVKRSYALLPPADDAVACLNDIVAEGGIAAVARLDEFCRG
jgi:cobalamin-dependent methionine synthase I